MILFTLVSGLEPLSDPDFADATRKAISKSENITSSTSLPVALPMKASGRLKSFSDTQCDSELIQNLSPGAVYVKQMFAFSHF